MRQDGQREAWWWLYHKCWGEGPQHISWYSGFFFLQIWQKVPGLLGFLCVVQRLTSDPGSGSTTHPGC